MPVDHTAPIGVTIGFEQVYMVMHISKIQFIMVPITVYDIDNNTTKYVDPNYFYFSTLPTL